MTELCAEGHVIDAGRTTCVRDGLPPSKDEWGNPITNEADTIMTDEVVAEGAPEEATEVAETEATVADTEEEENDEAVA